MRFALLGFALLSASIIACSGEKGGESSSEDPTIARAVIPLDLGCELDQSAFRVGPSNGRLEGKLTVDGQVTLFLCTEPAADPAGSPGVVVTCAEKPQTVHPGSWKVDVTQDGPVFRAVLIKGDGNDQFLLCKAPVKPGEKVASFADAKPIIQNTCHGCHRNGTFGTIDKIKTMRSAMIDRITNREMPRNEPTWLDTPEAKIVLDFLQRSPELE